MKIEIFKEYIRTTRIAARYFLSECRGSSAVVFALVLPMLLVAVGCGIDISRALIYRQRIASSLELSCAQAGLEINDLVRLNTKINDFSPLVRQVAGDRLSRSGLKTVSLVLRVADGVITLKGSASSENVFAKILNSKAVPVSVSRQCIIPSGDLGPPGQLIFMESFEEKHGVSPNSWTVLGRSGGSWNGWQNQGAGIEINGLPQLAGNVIRFGNFFAELDSDCLGSSDCSTNSTMSREFHLDSGDYELRYWYISRIRNSLPEYRGKIICGTSSDLSWASWNGQTNRIEVYAERRGNYNFSPKNIVDVCVYSDTWTERRIKLNVGVPGTYRFSWRAAGLEDTLGGLVDYIRLCKGVCP